MSVYGDVHVFSAWSVTVSLRVTLACFVPITDFSLHVTLVCLMLVTDVGLSGNY